MAQMAKANPLIDGYIFAIYHTKSADALKQTAAKQDLIYMLAGEILKAYEAKNK